MTTPADPLLPGSHTITIGGIPQRYHVAGTGPAVCLVHSGGPGLSWEYLRMPDLEQHLTLVYLEPIGTGESGRLPHPDDYRIDAYARFVHGVVEHLNAPATFLLGHSHGGFVAQRYVLTHPTALTGLILYATSPRTGEQFWAEALANLDRLPERHPGRAEVAGIRETFQRTLSATDDETGTEGLRAILPAYFADYWSHESELAPMRAGLRVWTDPMRAAGPPFDVRDELTTVTTPTLIVSGAHDFICAPHWGEMLHEAIPHSRYTLFKDSGHLAHIEEPAAFTSAIATFTQDVTLGELSR
ncbi:alpha/beta fold hydrolase [Nonomuraea rubra]|uniref:Proline iminopeptidase n=1 Tax=Nonomuraea rubra TaxID=46180 RepID=A0A7X0TXF0_9ACTN|nr:alpha/beta hydrolase [Nonomuraea rubra]MBB6547124.1 proline iminopeptidase [Nonomuraea rubra]